MEWTLVRFRAVRSEKDQPAIVPIVSEPAAGIGGRINEMSIHVKMIFPDQVDGVIAERNSSITGCAWVAAVALNMVHFEHVLYR